jgi:RimJ/RimL family protein N-acetyltransferase
MSSGIVFGERWAVLPSDGGVVLRPLGLADVDEWLAGEDDEQIRWFEFPRPAVRADVVHAIERWSESWRALGPVRNWAVCDTADGHILGGVELRDLGGSEVNLSYVVFPFARRQGVATRAAMLALAYAVAEMGARVAVIKILDGNVASLSVARRLGAVRAGTEMSERGGTFVVLRCELGWNDGATKKSR